VPFLCIGQISNEEKTLLSLHYSQTSKSFAPDFAESSAGVGDEAFLAQSHDKN
jgi:hypothetical protein